MSVAGVKNPTVTTGAGNTPAQSALISQQNNNKTLSALQKVGGGSSSSSSSSSSGGAVAVPQVTMQYTSQNGTSGAPNAQITSLTKTSTAGAANSVYDKQALQKGGNYPRRKTKRGKGKKRKRFISRKRKCRGSRYLSYKKKKLKKT
jgi:hypothetical protein